jgi:hypothetical protein
MTEICYLNIIADVDCRCGEKISTFKRKIMFEDKEKKNLHSLEA